MNWLVELCTALTKTRKMLFRVYFQRWFQYNNEHMLNSTFYMPPTIVHFQRNVYLHTAAKTPSHQFGFILLFSDYYMTMVMFWSLFTFPPTNQLLHGHNSHTHNNQQVLREAGSRQIEKSVAWHDTQGQNKYFSPRQPGNVRVQCKSNNSP